MAVLRTTRSTAMIVPLQVFTPRLGAGPAAGAAPQAPPPQTTAGDAFKPAPKENLSMVAQIKKKLFDGREFGKILGGIFGGMAGVAIGGVGFAIAGSTLAAPH